MDAWHIFEGSRKMWIYRVCVFRVLGSESGEGMRGSGEGIYAVMDGWSDGGEK
jgi:hypothetical protein